MMKLTLYPKDHHSTSDWTNLIKGAGWWQLSTDHYVSGPSSIEMVAAVNPENGWSYCLMVCNLPGAKNLLEGRMIINGYTVDIPPVAPYISGFAFGVVSADNFKSKMAYRISHQWKKSRLTWWNSFDMMNNPKLAYRRDDWIDGAWVEREIEYTSRLEGETNRCGLVVGWKWATGTHRHYFDDVEIWL